MLNLMLCTLITSSNRQLALSRLMKVCEAALVFSVFRLLARCSRKKIKIYCDTVFVSANVLTTTI